MKSKNSIAHHFNSSVKIEMVVEGILVVRDGANEREHQAAVSTHLRHPCAPVGVLPGDAAILFMHTNLKPLRLIYRIVVYKGAVQIATAFLMTKRSPLSLTRLASKYRMSPRQSQPSTREFALRPKPSSPASKAFFKQ